MLLQNGKKLISSFKLSKLMLTRILDTSEIDMSDPEIRSELETDLRRMNYMEHYDIPKGANAYTVTVRPSSQTYRHSLHRFTFEIRYGRMNNGEFEPQGEPVFRQTETLPMI